MQSKDTMPITTTRGSARRLTHCRVDLGSNNLSSACLVWQSTSPHGDRSLPRHLSNGHEKRYNAGEHDGMF